MMISLKDNINTILKQGKLLHSYIAKITEASIHITYDKQDMMIIKNEYFDIRLHDKDWCKSFV
mgnify:CR=1 FL=1